MKKYSFKTNYIYTSLLFVILTLMSSCAGAEDDHEPYGPEYDVSGLELYTDYYEDMIPASAFTIRLRYLSDNRYAQEYGINPKLNDGIKAITVRILNDGVFPGIGKNDDVSKYFVVDGDDDYYPSGLYQTIPQYIEKGEFQSSLYLVFTNQTALAPKYDPIITDTLNLGFRVELELNSDEFFSAEIERVLIP